MKEKILNLLKLFLGWPVSLIALFFIVRTLFSKGNELLPQLTHINIPFFLLGIACFFVFFCLKGIVWQTILKEKGYAIPFREALFLWETTEIKRYAPGNLWSILGKLLVFSEREIPKKTILSSMIIESELLLLGTITVSLLASSFILYTLLPLTFFTSVYLTPLLTSGVILLLLVFIYNERIKKYVKNKYFLYIWHLLPPFKNETTLWLVCAAICYMFLFGLGYYFVISSLIVLSPAYFLTIIGFLVFSFLVGYLSLITPMGLGVREGVMAYGLAKFIPLSHAGFASLWGRVGLIFSEILFFALTSLWYHAKNPLIYHVEEFIGRYKYHMVLFLLMLSYILYFTSASFLRHENFYTGRFDLGNMDQTVWNTYKGNLFELTDPNGTRTVSRLAFHADFILVLLGPLYFIWSDPRMLLLTQTITLAFGAVFVFLLGKRLLKNNVLSLTLAFAYLLNPALHWTNLYDFHAVTLATTFLLGAFYFLEAKKYIWFFVTAALAALAKEHIWLIVAFFGGYIFFSNILRKSYRMMWLGVGTFLVAISVFYFLIWHAIPQARGGVQHFALEYYSDFGDNPTSIVKNIMFSPLKTLESLLQEDRISYVLQLVYPLGFFSLLAPQYLLFAAPDLAINLLSNNAQLHQIYYQYSATITPFFFISSMYGLTFLKRRLPKLSLTTASLYLIFTTLTTAYFYGPLPGAVRQNLDMFTKPQLYAQEINAYLSTLSKDYSIAATNNLGSHLSQREKIFTIPLGMEEADIITFLLGDPYAQPSPEAQKEMVLQLKQDKNYIVLYEKGDFIVFRKRYVSLEK